MAPAPGGTSQIQRGTVRMHSTPPPQQASGAAALAANPLTSTLMMEQRIPTPAPGAPATTAKPALSTVLN